MENYLITYEDAKEISQKYNNNNFWEIQFMKGEYKVSSFNYFICGWDDFANPLPHKPHINAFDMRGVTFVFNEDGSLWKRFLMLPKFFNINQVESTQYGNIKNTRISNISVKEDGSLVAFMMLPNGKLFCKTIGSFTSDQSYIAFATLYTNEEHVEWVKNLLNIGYTPLFEYVSWDNRIVLKYGDAHLRFIGLRDNNTGRFLPAGLEDPMTIPEGMTAVQREFATLDEIIEKSKVEENKEGWVVMFEDGKLVKIKTDWYFRLHGLRTMNVFREDYIIENYLKENLDDIMSQLDPKEDKDAFAFVDNVAKAVDNYIKYIDKCTYELKNKFINEYNSDWHNFAVSCNKEPFFMLSKNLIETPDLYHHKRSEMIIKNAYRLKGAKQLVDKWSNAE